MASSNRHWPSMFKSKPCNTHHHQWQHDVNSSLVSNGCHRAPFTSVPGCEERSPEPKPRWNPKPEQIRILEAIFNSGMVNPPRDEIRKIRAQLQEYGQVGDANVFYWFQNRKSRSKHKQRHLQTTKSPPQYHPPTTTISPTLTTPSSTSSLSDKSSPKSADKAFSTGSGNLIDVTNSPASPVNQPYLQTHGDFPPEPFFFPVQQQPITADFTQGFCFPEISNGVHVADQTGGNCSSLLLSDLLMSHGPSKKVAEENMKLQQQLSYTATSTPISVPSTISHIQVPGCEERSPEPKPRWNPKPEQIRILEAIFNSGMVNPPRDEIRKIRAQLQEYGQVGDANVFYWFQNRKSRSKHKQRHLQTTKSPPQYHPPTTTISPTLTTPSSTSSLSDKSSPKSADKAFSTGSGNLIDVTNSPASPVNQPYLQTHGDFPPEPFFFPVQQQPITADFTQGFCFPEISNGVHVADQTGGNCSSLLLSDLLMSHGPSKKVAEENMKLQQQLSYTATSTPISVPSTISHIQGVGESGRVCPAKSTVFINDVGFEVGVGPFNVREAFGDGAVLIHSSGQPVLTNEWGVTHHSLQHGAFYYLVHTLSPSNDITIDLVL
ncbi:unnamed protein product [Ilex paraguariensis]|uniref:Protein WUSCHEL n=2 Tax=Magnoliopsida TaxID=3398 RepID=A0ABC8ULW3_9AQUA